MAKQARRTSQARGGGSNEQRSGASNEQNRRESADQARGESEKTADAIEMLSADHRKVEQLFEQYRTARRRAEKSKLAREICKELIIHAELEEEIFYPACREHVEDSKIDEAMVEHDGAKILISEIAVGSPSDEFFDAKVAVLTEYIRHHVQEEEKNSESIFAEAKAGGLDMAALGARMQARKAELMKEMGQELYLPQPITMDVTIGEEDMDEELAGRGESGRGRWEDEDRWGRGSDRGGRMPERDEYGRFMSEEEDERSSRGGRGETHGREDERRGASHGGWFGDPKGHSEASRRGWEEREGHRGRPSDEGDRRGSAGRGQGGRSAASHRSREHRR